MEMKLTIFYPFSGPTCLVYSNLSDAQEHVKRILNEYRDTGHFTYVDVDAENELVTYTVVNRALLRKPRTVLTVTLQPVRIENRGVDLDDSERRIPQTLSPAEWGRFGRPVVD